jgi:hypothetical protein
VKQVSVAVHRSCPSTKSQFSCAVAVLEPTAGWAIQSRSLLRLADRECRGAFECFVHGAGVDVFICAPIEARELPAASPRRALTADRHS